VKPARALTFSLAAAAGALAGWMLARQHLGRHRADLFSPRPMRRLAALHYLAGLASVETVRLLRDYIAWEPSPALRRRAERVVRRMELSLA